MELLLPEKDAVSRTVIEHHRDDLLARIAEGRPAPANAEHDRSGHGCEPEIPEVPGYRLQRVLGRGASGTVWRAVADEDGRPTALKIFHIQHRSPPHRNRSMQRELRASERIDHPGIVRIEATGSTADGRAFLVMKLVEGIDLEELIVRDAPLEWSRARRLLSQLCESLACAHDHGIVHRDLKPSNVIVSSTTDGEYCTIVDLGVSRLLSDSTWSTIDGTMIGTPAYMSPEQIRGAPVGPRADIYALGCVAYEMLCGRRPFQGLTPGEYAVQHLVTPPPPLQIPGARRRQRAIDAVIRRALAKKPEARFADMRSVAAALAEVESQAERARWWGRVRAIGLGSAALAIGVHPLAGALAPRAPDLGASPSTARVAASSRPSSESETSPAAVVTTGSGGRTTVLQLSLGRSHTCAVARDGRVQCWDTDGFDRLGRGTEHQEISTDELPGDLPPLGPLPLATVVDVALSNARTCAIVRNRGHRDLYCWARETRGASGSGSTHDLGGDEILDRISPAPLDTNALENRDGLRAVGIR